MANIQKRGESQYQADIRRKGYPRQIETFETKGEAREWARDQESKMDKGVFRDRRVVADLTLGDALDRYMDEVVPTKAPGGQRNERNRIRLLKKHPLAGRLLTQLHASDFAMYRNERMGQVGSANTVRLELALLSHLYTIGKKEWGWPLDHALKDVKRPSPPEGRERRLVGDEEARLLESAVSAKDVQEPIWLLASIRLALATGMRACELLSVAWDQVDLVNGVVKLTKARNGSKRAVGLNFEAVRVLRGLPRKGDRVIPGYYETGKLDADFKAARESAGIVDLVFHDLRHEAASRFAPYMMPQELAKIMGWKTLQMAMRYYNPSAQELASKMRQVEAARSGLPAPTQLAASNAAEPRQPEVTSELHGAYFSLADSLPDNVIHVEFSRTPAAVGSAARSA